MLNIIKKNIFKVSRIAKRLQNLPVEYKVSRYKKSLPGGVSGAIDNGADYLTICKLSAENDDIFNIFRRSNEYRNSVEVLSEKQGQEHLSIIKRNGGGALRHIHKFQENDKFGSPFTYNYDIGRFSPTTLRYIKILTDLEIIFGDLNNLDIVEIGAGYGGQCRIISSAFAPASYTIIDLELVLPLIKKYLGKFNVKNMIYLTPQQIDSKRAYDLIISNYAFSERPRSIQEDYIQKILYPAKRGYLACNCNNVSSAVFTYNKEELFKILSKRHRIEIMDEEPKTGQLNFIIKWNDDK